MTSTYKDTLSYREIEELFIYNPVDGKIIRRDTMLETHLVDYDSDVRIEFRYKPKGVKGLGKKYSIPARSIAWMLHYQTWATHVLVHRDFDKRNLKVSNLIEMPRKEYRQMLSCYNNYLNNCKVKKHKEDQYKFVVKYSENGRIYCKTFVDNFVAQKYAIQLKTQFLLKLRRFGMIIN